MKGCLTIWFRCAPSHIRRPIKNSSLALLLTLPPRIRRHKKACIHPLRTLKMSYWVGRLTGTPSHYPHQAGTHPSRINTCYGDPTTVRVHEAAYGDLPPTGTGHRPLYIDLIIPNLPPPTATLPDDTLPPTLQFPAEDDHGAWHR